MSKRLLLVEDEQDIRRVAEVSLTRIGKFEVVTAASGEEALVKAASGPFDAILLDVRMPGMDGPATLAQLQQEPETKEIPVIFLTANTQKQDIARFMSLGVKGVIPKPFDPMTLSLQVAKTLGWES